MASFPHDLRVRAVVGATVVAGQREGRERQGGPHHGGGQWHRAEDGGAVRPQGGHGGRLGHQRGRPATHRAPRAAAAGR